MCGIVGAVAFDGRLDPAIAAALPAMTDRLRHRGPDDEGSRSFPGAVLGHRRLSIIDRAGGHQPLSNEDGTCWIVFNGEVYNHGELRRELEGRGHRFRTRSDTEAILHAWEEFGEGCPERLSGMFAFAIYDERRHELFIARDRLGKKPLAYAVLGGVLHFASEMKALRESPCWDGALDPAAIEPYLGLGYVPAPATIYRSVAKLLPGHWLRLRDGQVEVREYWDVPAFDSDLRAPEAIVDDLDAAVRRAVTERLESEVPLGAFLSSGVDSGLVVSYMAEELGGALLTTTVGFDQQGGDEVPGARRLAEHLGVRHATAVIEPRLDAVFGRIVEAFDEPFADDSAIPTYYVSEIARRYVTVALSGDGGDESFGGYDFRYLPHAWEERLRPLVPGRPGRALARWLGRRWPRSPALPRALRLGTILDNLGGSAADAYFSDLCFVKPAEARAMLGLAPARDPRENAAYEAVTAPYRRCPSSSPLQRAQYADLKVYLPNMPLVKVDRMSMLHGLEVRCPLLDHRIVELAFAVPTRTKLPGLRAKDLLKRLAKRRLPAAFLDRPKRGFSAPIAAWLRGPCAGQFEDEVLGAAARVRGWLDRDVVARLFREHREGWADRSRHLWAAWVLERWLAGAAPSPSAGAGGKPARQ